MTFGRVSADVLLADVAQQRDLNEAEARALTRPPACEGSSAGVRLPGRQTTKTLVHQGQALPASQLQRGDLVLTSSGHIGLAVDSERMVHAPRTGDVVKVSLIWNVWRLLLSPGAATT